VKPELPGEGATRRQWLRYWKETRDWARKERDRLAKQIKRDKVLVERAEKKVSNLRRAINASSKPSRNFSYAEFNTKDGTPVPKSAYKGLDHLCQNYLEPLREKYGPISITSGYRHAAYNRRIGGASNSVHIYDHPGRDGSAVAADIVCAKGSPRDWAIYLDSLGVAGLGTYSSFVHLDNRDRMGWAKSRWSG
jgi:hypothetical protein